MSWPHQQTSGALPTVGRTRVVSEIVVSETVVILSIVLTAWCVGAVVG
jgi:hypothetical protein